jgi:hypothetical protein
MIHSSLTHGEWVYVCHEVSGVPTVEEIALAVHHTLQHGDMPVLWDLERVEFNDDLRLYESRLLSMLGNWRQNMSASRRAFIVPQVAVTEFNAFLERMKPPWHWAVFSSRQQALDWLHE